MATCQVCFLCKENLKVKYGSCVGTVPLFKVTKNKELTGKVSDNCNAIVLADLLESIGLLVVEVDRTSDNSVLCRKCARKIINCTTLYHDIKGGLTELNSNAGVKEKGQKVTKTDNTNVRKRDFDFSPSGLTPGRKRTLVNDTRKNTSLKSKKSLFQLQSSSENEENINDAISNLMCLPVAENEEKVSSVVKVSCYCLIDFNSAR